MLLLLIATITVLTITLLILHVKKPNNFPPGPVWYPILGSAPAVKKVAKACGGSHVGYSKLAEMYNTNVLGLKFGKENVIVVLTYPLIKAILTSDDYEGRPEGYFLKLRCMGLRRGITITDGPFWKTQRSFVSTHLRNLGYGKKPMEKLIREEVAVLLSVIKENENKEIRVGSVLAVSVLNVLWALMAGSRLNHDDLRLKRVLDLFDQRARVFDMSGGLLNQFPWLRFVAPEKTGYTLINQINRDLKELLVALIEEHYSTWDEGRNDDLIYAFITKMKNHGNEESTFTEDQLIMVCLDLFIGGAQTSSNTIDFACQLMILYPDIQEKVRNCLQKAFGRDEEITYSERNRVPYVEAVLCEILRFRHVAPIAGPRRVLRDTYLDNYFIPKDTTVLFSLYSVHNDKDYWKDPEMFRPERFLDSDGNLIYHERLIPFGLGKRRCLGDMLAKSCIFTFFGEMLRSFELSIYPGTEIPKGIGIPGITLTPEKYKAKFTERLS